MKKSLTFNVCLVLLQMQENYKEGVTANFCPSSSIGKVFDPPTRERVFAGLKLVR